jgi:hypothetical protein
VSHAQAVFVTVLALVALVVTGFGIYVASSPRWSRRWYRR